MTRDAAISRLRRTLVAYASTNERGLASEVVLDPEDDPVVRRCVVQFDVVQSSALQ